MKGTQGADPEARAEAEAMEEGKDTGLFSRTTCPEVAPPTMGWAPDTSVTRKMLHRLAYRSVLMRHLLNCHFLFSHNSSLCQVDKTDPQKKKKSTRPGRCGSLSVMSASKGRDDIYIYTDKTSHIGKSCVVRPCHNEWVRYSFAALIKHSDQSDIRKDGFVLGNHFGGLEPTIVGKQ